MNDRLKRLLKFLSVGLCFWALLILNKSKDNDDFKSEHFITILLCMLGGSVILFLLTELLLYLHYGKKIPTEIEQPLALPLSEYTGNSNRPKDFRTYCVNCEKCDILNEVEIRESEIEHKNYFMCENCKFTNIVLKETVVLSIKQQNVKSIRKAKEKNFKKCLNGYEGKCDFCDLEVILTEYEYSENKFICPECKETNIISLSGIFK